MGVHNVATIIIDAIHRKPGPKERPRAVIVRFLQRTDRQRVWDARRNLKGTPYSLNEDLPEQYNRSRSILVPIMKSARTAGYKATLVLDKVKIDGRLYGTDQLSQLHEKCNPALECVKVTDTSYCYFGRYTPLSNFHQCNLKLQGIRYNCTEQYIQHKKAESLGHDDIAQKILHTTDPVAMKQMGDSIKGNTQVWYDQARDIILPAIRAKFEQNPSLMDCLAQTGDRQIGEATRNQFWGIGLTLKNPTISDVNQWSGKNIMGQLLMSVREELK